MSKISEFLSANHDTILKRTETLLEGGGLFTLTFDENGKFSFLIFDANGEEIPFLDSGDAVYTAAMHFKVIKILKELGEFLDKRSLMSIAFALRD